MNKEISNIPKAVGKKSFQANLISKSQRNRGKVDRLQIQKNTNLITIKCVKIELGDVPNMIDTLRRLKK